MAVITRETECFPHQNSEQKRLHPHALCSTCLPLNGEQFPSRWQTIKGFTLLHLVKTLNKEVHFPSCSEREQAVLASTREQISPWHDPPPASRSGTETVTTFLPGRSIPKKPPRRHWCHVSDAELAE